MEPALMALSMKITMFVSNIQNMIQLICHLIGDFALQNDWMAEHKNQYTKSGWIACFIHCIVYTIPFLLITSDIQKLLLIFLSHFLIDKFSLARYWCNYLKVGVRFDWNNWIKIYLIFMVDMTMHLVTNYFILTTK